MREYAKVSPKFWTGDTGKEIRKKGPEAVVVAMYLMTSPVSNMLGLYYQPILYMAHETGLGIEGASKGLRDCIEAGFCQYDDATEVVWVVEMASYQIADELKASDKRCAGIQKDYMALQDSPFLGSWFDRYQAAFNLSEKRGTEGASKPHRSKEQEQEQEKEKDQEPPIPPEGGKAGKKARVPSGKTTFATFVQGCRDSGTKPIPAGDPIFAFADDALIPREFLELAWREFARKHRETSRQQKDWRAHFRNAVRGNWGKAWYFPADGEQAALTTVGVQLRREREAEAERRAAEQDQAA